MNIFSSITAEKKLTRWFRLELPGGVLYLFRCIGIRFIACHYAIFYANFALGYMARHSISCFRSNKKDPIFRVLWVFMEKY